MTGGTVAVIHRFLPLNMFTLSSWWVSLKAKAAWWDSSTLKSLYKMANSFPELHRNPLDSNETEQTIYFISARH